MKLYSVLVMLYYGDAVFSFNEMLVISIDLNIIKLGDTNYDEDDIETVVSIRLSAWHIKFENVKHLKKS